MGYTNTKAEKMEFFPKLSVLLNTNDQSLVNELFDQDFKMLVPGTGGREVNAMPLPPGIAGWNSYVRKLTLLKVPRHF